MKTNRTLRRTVNRSTRSIYLACSLMAFAVIALSAAPQWWTNQEVFNSNASNDYGAVNVGQLKHMADKARDEMAAKGYDVSTLDNELFTTYLPLAELPSDYHPVALGQLKFVSRYFYDLLGLAYPWNTDPSGPAADNAPANIGQVKYLFSFDIPELIPVDTEAPSIPQNFRTILFNHQLAMFEWDASTDNIGVTGYQLYRNDSILVSDIQDPYFTDTTVIPNTTYTYQLIAVDAAGNASAKTTAIVITTDTISDSDGDNDSGDGMDDVWEEQIVAADPDDDIESIADVDPDDDYDGDGITNLVEFENKLDPLVDEGLVSYTPRIEHIQTLGEGRLLIYTELNALNADTLNLERTIDEATRLVSTHGPNTNPLIDSGLPITGDHTVTYRIQAQRDSETGTWSSGFTIYLREGVLYLSDPGDPNDPGNPGDPNNPGNPGGGNDPQTGPPTIPNPSYAAARMLDSNGIATLGITNDGSILYREEGDCHLKKLTGEQIAITPFLNESGATPDSFYVEAISGDGHIIGNASYYGTITENGERVSEKDEFGILWEPSDYSQPTAIKDDDVYTLEDTRYYHSRDFTNINLIRRRSSIELSSVANGGVLGGRTYETTLPYQSTSYIIRSDGSHEPDITATNGDFVSKTFYNDNSEKIDAYQPYQDTDYDWSGTRYSITNGYYNSESHRIIDMNGTDVLLEKKHRDRVRILSDDGSNSYYEIYPTEYTYWYNDTELDYKPTMLNNPVEISDSDWSNVTWIVGRKDDKLVASIDFGQAALTQINIDDYTATPHISDADENGLIMIAAGPYLYKQEYLIDSETGEPTPLPAFERFYIARDILKSPQDITVKGISDNGIFLLDIELGQPHTNAAPEQSDALEEGYYALLRVDLDIDGDNTNGTEEPDRSLAEDDLEDDESSPGKVVGVNNGDYDFDNIPDYYDGFDGQSLQGVSFTKLIVEMPKGFDYDDLKLKFQYNASDPSAITIDELSCGSCDDGGDSSWTTRDGKVYRLPHGDMRIWTKDAVESRNSASVALQSGAGHFVPSNTEIAFSALNGNTSKNKVTLYLEGIKESDFPEDHVIGLQFGMAGSEGSVSAFYEGDEVRVTITDVAFKSATGDILARDDYTFGAADFSHNSGAYGSVVVRDTDSRNPASLPIYAMKASGSITIDSLTIPSNPDYTNDVMNYYVGERAQGTSPIPTTDVSPDTSSNFIQKVTVSSEVNEGFTFLEAFGPGRTGDDIRAGVAGVVVFADSNPLRVGIRRVNQRYADPAYIDFDAPSFTATDAQALEDYLNNQVYNQASISWQVSILPEIEVDYDIDHDSELDKSEDNAIMSVGNDPTYDYIMYLVKGIEDAGGYAYTPGRSSFHGHWSSDETSMHTAAHELGHSLGLPHPFEYASPFNSFPFLDDFDPENIMNYTEGSNGTKLRFPQWIEINPFISE